MGPGTVAAASALRAAGFDAELASVALTQAGLRRHAVGKFGADAARMYFTRPGLEQATRHVVATRRAARLAAGGQPESDRRSGSGDPAYNGSQPDPGDPAYNGSRPDPGDPAYNGSRSEPGGPAGSGSRAGRLRRVADLGCGIGADAIALARAGLDVLAVEADPGTAAVARANAAALGLDDRLTVHCGDATEVDLSEVDAVFCDPARREARGGRRVFDPAAFSPPWSFVMGLPGGRSGPCSSWPPASTTR